MKLKMPRSVVSEFNDDVHSWNVSQVSNHKNTINSIFYEDFIRKSTKIALLTKCIHMYISHHQLHIQTLYIIQDVV